MTAAELAKLQRAAHHEAGHAVVAQHATGVRAAILIERRQRGSDVWFTGRCTHVVPHHERDQRLISLAGPVAEVIFEGAPLLSGEATCLEIEKRMSHSDRTGAGYWIRDRLQLQDAWVLVHRLWPAIQARAAEEIRGFIDAPPGAAGVRLNQPRWSPA